MDVDHFLLCLHSDVSGSGSYCSSIINQSKPAAITWHWTWFLASISCTSRCSVCCSRCLMASSSVSCDAVTPVGVAVSGRAADTGCMLKSLCLFATWASRNARLMNAFGQREHYNAISDILLQNRYILFISCGQCCLYIPATWCFMQVQPVSKLSEWTKLTVWLTVNCSPHAQRSHLLNTSETHLCRLTRQRPWPGPKWFSRDHERWGTSNPDCQTVR